jgi:dTDP-4-amino-4,6-dideoxygalactose transaminase
MTTIPVIDFQAQFASLRDEIHGAVDRVSQSHGADQGSEVEALEREAAAYGGCRHAVVCSSSRSSPLLLALTAQGIGPTDQVITSVCSLPETAGAIALRGARPVLADINPVTFNLQTDSLDLLLTERTRAIIPIHCYGQSAEMAPILELAKQHGLVVIEDAGRSVGAKHDGRQVGSMGVMGSFYFSPTESFGTFGDTGMVTTNDRGLAACLRSLRDHGTREGDRHVVFGASFKLDPMRAAILRVKLRHLDEWIAARQRIAGRYNRLFEEAGAGFSLDEVKCLTEHGCRRQRDCVLLRTPKIVLPLESPAKGRVAIRADAPPFLGHRHVYSKYVIRTGRRDALIQALQKAEVGCETGEAVLLELNGTFAPLRDKRSNFPAADCAAKTALALPMYPELTEEQQEKVVRAVVAGLRG